MRPSRPLLIVASCACLVGCVLGPDAPKLAATDAGLSARESWESSELTAEEAAVARALADAQGNEELVAWWTRFGDPALDRLIARADRSNADLGQALSRVRIAQAQLGVAESDLWPDIAAGANYDRIKQNFSQLAAQGVDTSPYSVWAYGLAMGSWEIDLWGRVRRLIDAANQDLRAGVDDLRSAIVSVRAGVATTYMEVRTLEARMAALESSVSARLQTLDLAARRFEAGTATQLELNRATADLEAEAAKLPGLRSSRAQALGELAQLCGTSVDEVSKELGAGSIPAAPVAIDAGIPATLLERRPDLRAAAERYSAAVSRIGAAEAAKWPTLTLSGNFYISATDFSGLGDWSNRAYSFGPSLMMPVFTAGRLDAQIAASRAQAELAFNAWRSVLVRAVAEVDSSIAGAVLAAESRDRFERALASASDTERLGRLQYEHGTITLDHLLDLQDALYSVQDAESQARGLAAQSAVALYRALGGGWQDVAPLQDDAMRDAATATGSSPADAAARDPSAAKETR
ncbi:MAG: efflux transporter outer membrane subunit [Phycisphaerae bacterium]|nr:efflux transporter outer membrane subunit [Phycisphaerae bacterium]